MRVIAVLRYPSSRQLWALLGVGAVIGLTGLFLTNENNIGSWGLVNALNPLYYVGVIAALASFVLALGHKRQPTTFLVIGIVVLVVLLHGSATIVESQARFTVAWLHVGFIESITSLGHATTWLDARMSWPAFFSGAGVLAEAMGLSSASSFLRFAPIFMLLCYLPSLYAIGRMTLPGWRRPWLGLLIFLLLDWVGQDYFAPQSVGIVIYLAFMAMIVSYYRRREPGPMSRWLHRISQPETGWRRPLASLVAAGERDLEPEEFARDRRWRAATLVMLAMLACALVSTHQLTPVFLIFGLGGLMVVGRLRPWPLIVLVLVAILGYLSYAAKGFWSGHLDEIFGGLGNVGGSVDSGVSERVTGSQAHLFIVQLRVLFTVGIWGLAGVGAIRLWLQGKRVSVVLLVLLGAPIGMVAAQSYGGEGLLRVLLLSLPGACMLIATLALPKAGMPSRRSLLLTFVGLLALLPVFLLCRWGNESFERVSAQDVALRQAFYDHAKPGATLINFAQGGPGAYQGVTVYKGGPDVVSKWPIKNIKKLDADTGNNPEGTFLVISKPQVAFAVENLGIPADAGEQVAQMAVKSQKWKVVYQNDSGILLQRVSEPAAS